MTLNFRGLGTGYRPVLLTLAMLLLLGFMILALGGLAPKLPLSSVNQLASVSWVPYEISELTSDGKNIHRVPGKLALGQLPLRFEPNQGQTDSRVKFLARGAG